MRWRHHLSFTTAISEQKQIFPGTHWCQQTVVTGAFSYPLISRAVRVDSYLRKLCRSREIHWVQESREAGLIHIFYLWAEWGDVWELERHKWGLKGAAETREKCLYEHNEVHARRGVRGEGWVWPLLHCSRSRCTRFGGAPSPAPALEVAPWTCSGCDGTFVSGDSELCWLLILEDTVWNATWHPFILRSVSWSDVLYYIGLLHLLKHIKDHHAIFLNVKKHDFEWQSH